VLKLKQVVGAPATHAAKPGTRLSSALATLSRPSVRSASPAAQARAMSLPAAGPGSIQQVGGDVVVDVRAATTSPGLEQALRDAGGRVLATSAQYRTVTVAVAPADLSRLAAVPEVQNVQEVLTPMRSGLGGTNAITCPGGSVLSEADTQMQAAAARSANGVNGGGVTVGVLSDSFNKNAGAATNAAGDVSSGDLPGGANPCGFTTPVNVVQDAPSSSEDEGRAMLQTVHDLAPGARLSFATALISETNFANNITNLRTAGANVIADDITYFDEPYFQDGLVDASVRAAVAAGVPYYSSAANNNFIQGGVDRASWEAPSFRPDTCPLSIPGFEDSCMNFGTPAVPANEQPFRLASGGQLQLDFQWAQPWFGVSTDYDIFLLNDAGTVIASSDAINPGAFGTQKPFEIFSYVNNTGAAQTVWLVIGNATGASGPRMKWTMTQPEGNGVVAVVNSVSPGDLTGPAIFGHNGTGAGMSVGAVPFDDSASIEDFSSRGPVTHYFGPVNGTAPAAPLSAAQVLAKPDIAATDGGATTFFAQLQGGIWRFFGTSESAPQAAAVAALEKEAAATASAEQLMNVQKATATHLAAFGPTAQGAGLVNALAAVNAIKTVGSAPTVVTGGASGVTTSAAQVAGTINPQAFTASYRFQFGTTTAYGAVTPTVAAGSGLTTVAAAAALAGLTPGTVYHYRLVALDRGAVVATGADRMFTTVRPTVPPPVARFSVAGARRQRVSGRTVFVRVFCSQACTGRVSGRLKIAGHRGTLKLKAVTVNLAAGTTKKFKLRLTKKQAAAVRKALRKHKRVTANATISLRSGTTVKTLRKTIVVRR
jgi:hypothetical protein